MTATDIISDAAQIATTIAVVFLGVQLWLGRSQSRTAFEDDLSQQYRRLIATQLQVALLSSLTNEQAREVEGYYQYLDLCNEQTFLRMTGRVRKRTWREWSNGIQYVLEETPTGHAWAILREGIPLQFKELQRLQDTGFEDPRSWQPWWRRILSP